MLSPALHDIHCGSKKNVPTLADYNYDIVHSILIIFSKLFVNDHKSCPTVKFSTAHMLPLYLVKHNALFALITLLIAKNTHFLRVALKRTG